LHEFTPNGTIECDWCDKQIEKKTTAMGCHICDYDVCCKCFEPKEDFPRKKRRKLNQKAEEMEEESSSSIVFEANESSKKLNDSDKSEDAKACESEESENDSGQSETEASSSEESESEETADESDENEKVVLSKYEGVCRNGGRWYGYRTINRRKFSRGFDTEVQAAKQSDEFLWEWLEKNAGHKVRKRVFNFRSEKRLKKLNLDYKSERKLAFLFGCYPEDSSSDSESESIQIIESFESSENRKDRSTYQAALNTGVYGCVQLASLGKENSKFRRVTYNKPSGKYCAQCPSFIKHFYKRCSKLFVSEIDAATFADEYVWKFLEGRKGKVNRKMTLNFRDEKRLEELSLDRVSKDKIDFLFNERTEDESESEECSAPSALGCPNKNVQYQAAFSTGVYGRLNWSPVSKPETFFGSKYIGVVRRRDRFEVVRRFEKNGKILKEVKRVCYKEFNAAKISDRIALEIKAQFPGYKPILNFPTEENARQMRRSGRLKTKERVDYSAMNLRRMYRKDSSSSESETIPLQKNRTNQNGKRKLEFKDSNAKKRRKVFDGTGTKRDPLVLSDSSPFVKSIHAPKASRTGKKRGSLKKVDKKMIKNSILAPRKQREQPEFCELGTPQEKTCREPDDSKDPYKSFLNAMLMDDRSHQKRREAQIRSRFQQFKSLVRVEAETNLTTELISDETLKDALIKSQKENGKLRKNLEATKLIIRKNERVLNQMEEDLKNEKHRSENFQDNLLSLLELGSLRKEDLEREIKELISQP